ncbi:hypothetical protein R5R35_011682 [Gryllus longicercus]|uniref:Apolipophorin n=1 Tax=Gryllus longicercus TaxID=2509291 RepID=A0AAN9VDS9_9ORTH
MGTHLWSAGLWLVLLAAVGTHSAAGPGACPRSCPKTSSVFSYQDGKKYTYSLEGTTVTTLPGTQGDVSTVHLKAIVEVGVKSTCSHVVRIKNLQIIGPDEKKHTVKELEGSPIIANFQGGLINSQICTAPGESQAALNIKRAVLSLLQSSAPSGSGSTNIREVDIFGICPTDISFSRSGETITIKKARNLNRCSHREDIKQEFLSTPFVGNADLQSVPLLESTQHVEQTVKKGVIVNVVSEETYLFRPFAKQSAGARTTVRTQLTLTGEKAQALTAPETVNVPRSIIFEDDTHQSSQKSNKQSIIAALQAARDSMPDVAGVDSARKFQALVGVLRHSSKDDILSVYGEVKAGAGFSNKQAARKVLLDALFRAGTGDSIGVAVELIRNNEISGEYTKLWYSAFAFVRHASLSSVSAVSSLLDEQNLPREALLGIGSLAGRYCHEHTCENVQQVNELISKLAKRLTIKITSRDDENKVIAALKALHNIHHLNNAVAETLQKLASDHSVPIRVRVAALETYQSDACRPKLKKSALEILNNRDEDSEVRIKAYLVLVECPCGTVANNLKELLENEPVNQVGAYIVSHLRNLRASANPSKSDAKSHLGLLRARKHYPEDIRKFSRNYELSYILDALNIGTSIESDVIFSQDSYVPRSVFLNLTTNLFGHSYNILELGTRVENADRLLESILGPKGYLKTHAPNEIVENIQRIVSKYVQVIKDRAQTLGRHKRSINKEDLDRIRNEVVKSLPPSLGNELLVDLSLKIFGSEILWLSNCDQIKDISPEKIISKIFDALENSIEKAKKFDHHVKQHWTFLDTELTYPTGAGLPLRLISSGSTAVHLKLAGQIDIHSLIHDYKNALFQLEIIPSAAVEVTGELLIDAFVVESGLKVAYTLHTATGSNIAVKILEGTGVDVSFGLPLKKQDILTLKTEVLKTVQETGHAVVDIPLIFTGTKKEFHGCFDQIKEITGLVVCGDVLVPFDSVRSSSAFYPLNGPSLLSVRVESPDVDSYHVKAYLDNKDPSKRTLELLLETPNSKVQRRLALLVEGKTEPNKELKISVTSPWKSFALQGILIDTSAEQSITAKLTSDDILYSIKAGVKVSGDESHQTYTPILEYKYPEQKSGVKKGGKTSQIYNVLGSVTVDRSGESRKYTFNKVALRTPYGQYELDGSFTKDTNLYATDAKISWDNKYIIVKNKLQKLGDHQYEASVDVIPSVQKDLSIGVRWKYERKPDELRNDLVIIHGQDLRNDQTRITLSQYFHYRIESPTNFDISTRNSLTYPILNIHAQVDGAATPKSIDYNLKASYDMYKVGSELHAKTGIKNPGDYDIKFIAEVQNNTLNIASSRDIVDVGKSKFVNVFELVPVTRYELVADVTHVYQTNNINLQSDALLKISGKPDVYKVDVGLIFNSATSNLIFDSHAKILIGSDKLLDASALHKRENDYPTGQNKLYIKNYLDASSSYNFNNAGGKATLSIDIPKIQRKIEGNVILTIEGTVYTADGNLQWHAGVDPSQQLAIHSVNDIRQDSIESKNTLTILDQKTILNLKGALTGKLSDGHLIINSDLILPNSRQITVKLDRVLQIRDISEGRVEFVLVDTPSKGSQPRRLVLSGGASNVNPKLVSFEGDGNLEYFTPEGKNLKVNVKADSKAQDEHRNIGGELHVGGSLIPKSLEIKSSGDISKDVISYKASGALGSDIKGSTEGSIHTGIGGKSPVEIDSTIEVILPNENVKQFKLHNKLSVSVKKDSPCEVISNNIISWNNDHTLKLDGQFTADAHSGQGSAKVVITPPNEQSRSVALTWLVPTATSGTEIKRSGSATFHWDGDKEAKFIGEVVLSKGDDKSFKAKFTADTPYEKVKHLDLTVNSKLTDDNVETNGVLNVNDKKVTLDSKVGVHGTLPLIDITVVYPEGTSKLYVNFDTLTREQIKGQIINQCTLFGGWDINANIDATLSIESPKLRLDLHAPRFKIDKWHIEADQRAVKGAKRIVFSIKSHDKTVVAGSTTLRHKQDANSETYDGAGTIEVGDQGPKRFNFRLDRVQLTQDANHETGLEYKFNVDAGENSLRSALKSSNREASYSVKYCAKDLCSNAEASTKIVTGGLNEISHDAVFVIDLKNLEVPVGISIREHTERRGWSLNHEADIQLQHGSHRTAYNVRAIVSDNGLVANVTLPKRVLSLEALSSVKLESSVGEQELTLQLWWDRVNKPSLRTVASVAFSQKNDKNGFQLSSHARFNNPSLERELSVKGYLLTSGLNKLFDASLELDVFKKANQKILITSDAGLNKIADGYNLTSTLEVKSKGQNIDLSAHETYVVTTSQFYYYLIGTSKIGKNAPKEIVFNADITKEKFYLSFKVPNGEVILIDGKAHIGSSLPADATIDIGVIGLQPVVIHTTAQKRGIIAVTTTISRKGAPNKKLIISGGIENGVYLRAEVIKQSENKELAHIVVSGKEKDFLKTDFSYSTENIKHFSQEILHELEEAVKKGRDFANSYSNEISNECIAIIEILKKSQPNVPRLLEVAEQELKSIRIELENDEVLKSVTQNLKDALGGLLPSSKALEDAIKEISAALQTLLKNLQNFQVEIIESLKKLAPTISELWTALVNLSAKFLENLLQEISKILNSLADLLKKYEPEIKKLINTFSELFHDVTQAASSTLRKIADEIVDLSKIVVDGIKDLPVTSVLKEKYAEFVEIVSKLEVPTGIWNVAEEVINLVKGSVPNPEIQELITAIEAYVEKHVKKLPVDDRAELKKIYEKLVVAIKSLVNEIQRHLVAHEPGTGLITYKLPLSLTTLYQIPRLFIVHLSPLSYLASDDLPRLVDLYYAYRPSLNPLEWIPPFRATGILIHSNNFITFDNRYYTFKGSCSYVLAQDYLDGNFSLVLTLDNGKLKAITVSDNSDLVELSVDKSLKVNGAASEYPVQQGDIQAWRRYYSINIKSKAGIFVHCHTNFDICVFHVSGFYHGRTRGLLGTIDNEQYNDFSLPNGKVVEQPGDFANAWKLNGQCADTAVQTISSDSSVKECTDIFGGYTVLRACYPFADPTVFREACNSAVPQADNKLEVACTFGASYVELCQRRYNIPINLPQSCQTLSSAKCNIVGGEKIAPGEHVTVKSPQKAADIVIVVEQVLGNAEVFRELVTPLVVTVNNDLKKKGITDVNYALIGYGAPGQKWPAHLTSNGNIGFGGKNVKFLEKEPLPEVNLDKDHWVQWLKVKIEYLSQRIHQSEAYIEAVNYPFRAGAAKLILGVTASSCPDTSGFLSQIRQKLARRTFTRLGLNIHQIMPIEDLRITGKDQAKVNSIVGFDSTAVYTLDKKKSEGDAALRNALEYKSNICADVLQAANGVAYNSLNFLKAKGAEKKQFVNAVSSRITAALTGFEQTEECLCYLDDGVHPETLCHVTDRTPVARKAGGGVKG